MIDNIVLKTKIIGRLKKRDIPYYDVACLRRSEYSDIRIYKTYDTYIEYKVHYRTINEDINKAVDLFKISF